jgi:hypothetical protein
VFKGPDSSSALTKWEANSRHLIVGEFEEFDELDVPARTSVEWNVSIQKEFSLIA